MALSTRTTSFTLPGFNWRRGKQAWDKHTWLYLSVIAAVASDHVGGVWSVDVGTGKKTRIADGARAYDPSFSPDGKRFVYVEGFKRLRFAKAR